MRERNEERNKGRGNKNERMKKRQTTRKKGRIQRE
jgi:hypothetical protein